MAGRPKRAQLVKAVNAVGGEDALIERIEGGETIASIAESLGTSRPMLSSFLNRSSNTKERIRRARETCADSLVEATLAIADSATHENDRAKRLQVSTRQWLASKFNRQAYGDSPTVAMQFNMGELMLDALKQSPPPIPPHLVVDTDDTKEQDTTRDMPIEVQHDSP
ncbi:MAG: hypothetical protein O3A53_20840 [Acidobacteria bacterium]|nr:hypothetical protein [Acidobacteriota bacterium]MDA1237226.1 hypothetical protein [Acidobacteriota bacterium]